MTLETKQKVMRLLGVADGLRRIQEFESARYLDEYAAHLTQPAQAVDAWMTDDGRVISAKQKAAALKDGGASASSVAPYNIPLTAALAHTGKE